MPRASCVHGPHLGIRAGILLVGACMVAGCGDWIWKNSGHPALATEQIEILVKTPTHYERLGTVTHLYSEGAWTEGGDGTAIVQDLLKETSAMGANVLLLVDDTTMADTAVSMTYQGKTYRLPVIGKTKTIVAQGIFVTKE